MLVGKGSLVSLDQDENKVRLSVMDDGKGLAQGSKELFASEGLDGAT